MDNAMNKPTNNPVFFLGKVGQNVLDSWVLRQGENKYCIQVEESDIHRHIAAGANKDVFLVCAMTKGASSSMAKTMIDAWQGTDTGVTVFGIFPFPFEGSAASSSANDWARELKTSDIDVHAFYNADLVGNKETGAHLLESFEWMNVQIAQQVQALRTQRRLGSAMPA